MTLTPPSASAALYTTEDLLGFLAKDWDLLVDMSFLIEGAHAAEYYLKRWLADQAKFFNPEKFDQVTKAIQSLSRLVSIRSTLVGLNQAIKKQTLNPDPKTPDPKNTNPDQLSPKSSDPEPASPQDSSAPDSTSPDPTADGAAVFGVRSLAAALPGLSLLRLDGEDAPAPGQHPHAVAPPESDPSGLADASSAPTSPAVPAPLRPHDLHAVHACSKFDHLSLEDLDRIRCQLDHLTKEDLDRIRCQPDHLTVPISFAAAAPSVPLTQPPAPSEASLTASSLAPSHPGVPQPFSHATPSPISPSTSTPVPLLPP